MSTKSPHTRITLSIAGKAERSAFTTNFNPSFLLTILKGLSALRAHKDFKLLKAFCLLGMIISAKLATTTVKSN